jgi:hypothetical protein
MDGLDPGYSDRRAKRFAFTEHGFERDGKLYKTFDHYALAALLGVRNPALSMRVNVVPAQQHAERWDGLS